MAGEELPEYALPVSWILLVIQSIMVFALLVAVREIRNRDMDQHHRIVYPAIVLQYLIFMGWMGPGALFAIRTGLFENPLQELPIIIHAFFGSIALLGSLFLVIFWVVQRREVNEKNLEIAVPVMKITLVSWILAYILGIWVFIHIYY